MGWFMERIRKGGFEVRNPYGNQVRHIPATPSDVHTIVFWSKNFGPFLRGGYGHRLTQMGYHLFFNFTINSESKWLEPHVPPLSERLNQLVDLARTYSPESITWRFDPICRFRSNEGKSEDNLAQFETIADVAGTLGLSRCITSFMDFYPKILKRADRNRMLTFIPIPLEEQGLILKAMQSRLAGVGLRLFTCCEKELLQYLGADSGISEASCIPNDLLMCLFGGELSLKKDAGQRVSSGCGCLVSKDIGAYDQHPCFHNCLYCYANPSCPMAKGETGKPSGRGGRTQ